MWQMADDFILRSAGFQADWMERLAFPQTAALIDVALDAADVLDALANELVQTLRPLWGVRRDSGLRWKTLQKRLQQRQALSAAEITTCQDDPALLEQLERWNATVETLASARAAAEQNFETELAERRAALRELAGDARFQEAVFLS